MKTPKTQQHNQRFDVTDIAQLAELLKVTSGEIAYVLSKMGSLYRRENKLKPNGTFRTLLKPRGSLRDIQDKIKNEVLTKVSFPSWVQGGVAHRSVRTNAKHHLNKQLLSTMDIKDCFPSITMHKVRGVFEELGFSGEALALITKLTTWQFQLPQGTPTSPLIANLALAKVDRRQIGLAKQHGFTYTRYVDDIAASGGQRLRSVRNLQERILGGEGFAIKPLSEGQKKIMIQDRDRQQLTGLVLNQKVNLPREKRQEIAQDADSAMRKGIPLTEKQKGKLSWLHSVNPASSIRIIRDAKKAEKKK